MKTTWQHDEIFPLIENIIGRTRGGWILSYEIGYALLRYKRSRSLVEDAAQRQGNPLEWVACNMVAWYSQRITRGTWDSPFIRQRVKRMTHFNRSPQWAYRAA